MNNILEAPTSKGSFIWNSIMKARQELCSGFRFKVGRGDANFWYSNWLGTGPISFVVPYVDIHDAEVSIKDLRQNGVWQLDRLWTQIPEEVLSSILSQDITFMTVWKILSSGLAQWMAYIQLVEDWILDGEKKNGILFLAILWEVWLSRNATVFSQQNTPIWEVVARVHSLVNVVNRTYGTSVSNRQPRWVRWVPPILNQIALNTDGSFYGAIGEGDILGAELVAILQGLKLCWELQYKDVKCMTDSQLALSLILGDVSKFHMHAGIVKEIRKLISREWNVTKVHTA
ncbi:Ribonuclease H domain [Sesbania bispinosa]|nr:Ribonuclease H domain [Sesbania bispinosa]